MVLDLDLIKNIEIIFEKWQKSNRRKKEFSDGNFYDKGFFQEPKILLP